jgi:succinoglycan biosynthesis transport protein ExoP
MLQANIRKNATNLGDILWSACRVVRCQLPTVSLILLSFISLAIVYLLITPPKYSATGEMEINTRRVQVLQRESVLSDLPIDSSTAQTQVEVLKSEKISLAVIYKLHLNEDPEFVGSGNWPIGRLIGFFFGQGEATTEAEKEENALTYFEEHRTVNRQGLTYVILVGFTSLDPEKSARIVNTIMKAYVEDQIASKYEATHLARDWLAERLKELRAQASAADRAVAEFKEKNNIVDTGGVGLGKGRLLDQQQISEINSQFIFANVATAEAKARLERIRELMSRDIPDASVADSLKNEVIIKLREQYLALAQRQTDLSQKYGSNHSVPVNLRSQMQEVRASIADEMRKIAESYKSDYEIALTRENSLRKSLENAVGESHVSNQAQVQLRELQSSADSTRSLHDNFLQRYMEAVEQKDSIPISDTRQMSPAKTPLKSSSPKYVIILAVATAVGSVLSFAVAYLREASSRVLRTTSQVEDILHVNCLAMVPRLKITPLMYVPQGESTLVPKSQDFLSHVVGAPFSRYAEAIRSIKVAADLSGELKSYNVIGVTSTLPNEGKSTIASNLAYLIADAGRSVILVDADLRSPFLTQRLAPNSPGLLEVIIGHCSVDSAIVKLPPSKLRFLAAGATSKLPHTNEILASALMKTLIDTLRAKYDYVIVDLSPVAPIVDVRTTAHLIDTYVYVVEWGTTKVEVIERGFAVAQGVYDRLLGVALNKVDLEAQSRYENSYGNFYHYKHYSKYGSAD